MKGITLGKKRQKKDHLRHSPGDVDLICDTVLISCLTRLVEIWLNLLSECARKLLLDKTAGFNDLMYSPVDWTAVRRGGQVPGELLGSDGERKLVGKVDICRSFPILDTDTKLARNSILHGGSNYATWGDPEIVFCPLAHSPNSWQVVNKSNNQKAVRLMRETWKAKVTRSVFLPLRVITGRQLSPEETSASLSPLSRQLLCYCCSACPSHTQPLPV